MAASICLHAVALTWLGQQALARLAHPPEPERPDMIVELRRLPPDTSEPAEETAAPRTARDAARPTTPLPAPPRAAAPSPLRAAPLPPSPLAPLTSPAAPPAPARGPGMGPSAPAGSGGAAAARAPSGPEANLGGLLREAVGCGHEAWMRLSIAERARCDKGFAAAAKRGDRFPLPDAKLAAFAAGAAANERKRAGREGSLPNTMPPCDPAMVGSNMMPSCLPKEAMHTVLRF